MGEFYALATAVVWAAAVIFFKRSGETVPPFALNLFRVGVSSVLLLLTLAVVGQLHWPGATLRDYLMLSASGVVGIALSDTLFHRCLNIVGAGINAVIDALYSPFIVLFAFLLLDERLGAWQLSGMGLVVGGVLVAGRHAPPAGVAGRTLAAGVMWGVLAMATVALGIVIAKPVLGGVPVLWATTVRQVASLAVMLPVALLRSQRGACLQVFRPRRDWRFALPGTVLGSYAALLLWIAGMKYTQAGAAAILNQTSTVYVLVFASLFLHEPFTRRKALAAALAVGGILMVTLG